MSENKTNLNEVQTAGTAPLGIYANCSPPFSSEKDGNNLAKPEKKKDLENKNIFHENRIKRYYLLQVARKYLLNHAKEVNAKTEELHKISRTINCKYALSFGENNVFVEFNSKNAYYTGLQTCGSVWNCPVCSARISEYRRQEIAKAVEKTGLFGYQSIMVTFTFPHTNKMPLKDLLKKQSEALALFRKGDTWDTFKDKVKFYGLIRALEVTYGKNGWHPHTHELWFIDCNYTNKKYLNEFILNRWINCLKKVGLIPENPTDKELEAVKKRAVDIKMNCKASDYLSKNDSSKNWGVDRELSKAVSKGRAKGMHVFQFLATESALNQKLYIEFINAMKGKRQIFWSQELKKKIGIDDKTDDEILSEVEIKEKMHEEKIIITKTAWKQILDKNYRAEILNRFEKAKDLEIEIQEILKFLNE